jgi:hypothetical protein
MGPRVVRLKDGRTEMALLVQDARILDLALAPGAGLFFATGSGVGFVGPADPYFFILSPAPRIRAFGTTLYVDLREPRGILAIDSVEGFRKVPPE